MSSNEIQLDARWAGMCAHRYISLVTIIIVCAAVVVLCVHVATGSLQACHHTQSNLSHLYHPYIIRLHPYHHQKLNVHAVVAQKAMASIR